MYASELIEELQNKIDMYGDSEVMMWENDFRNEYYLTTIEGVEKSKCDKLRGDNKQCFVICR